MTWRRVSDICRSALEQTCNALEDQTHVDELQEMRAYVLRLARLLREGKRSYHGDLAITCLQELWETVDYKTDPESYIDAINQAIWLMLELRGCLGKQSEKSEAS